jgi:hypothetical protein
MSELSWRGIVPAKNFFKSKLNWVGFCMILLGLLEMFQYTSVVRDNPVIMEGIGFLIIILRTYFVKRPVDGPVASVKKVESGGYQK